MEKISVLISGNDTLYIKSLGVNLSEGNKDMFVTCYSPERVMNEQDIINEKFDVFIFEEGLFENQNNFQKKIIYLSDRVTVENENNSDKCIVFKYQSIKNISAVIYNCYLNYCIKNNKDARNKNANNLSDSNLVNIGVTGRNIELYGEISIILSRALSAAGKKVTFFDLQEFYETKNIRMVKQGIRTWDDFIYCGIYGKTMDIMKNPEKFASADEWGVLYFEGKEEKNPFFQLDSDEINSFLTKIKNEYNQEFAVSVLPELDNPELISIASRFDLIIIVNYGNKTDIYSGMNYRRALESRDEHKENIITLCYGGKWDSGEYSDFNVRFTNNVLNMNMKEIMCTDTWNDVVRIARYIGDGCFE